MIISASRRTDIPALYADWFFNRMEAGFVTVPNPYNAAQVRTVSLRPEEVAGVVFWTRNSDPMRSRLDRMGNVPFYFQISLTPYGPDLEPGLPDTGQRIEKLLRLADRIGPDRVIWRYDPILLNPAWTPARHEEAFGEIAHAVGKAVRHCVFSYLDRYAKVRKNLERLEVNPWTEEQKMDMAVRLSTIAATESLDLHTCAEDVDLSAVGIRHGRCVDPSIFEEQNGVALPASTAKDPNQRPSCRCAPSVDIGMYDTCVFACAYCYANRSSDSMRKRILAHSEESPMLTGVPKSEDGRTI